MVCPQDPDHCACPEHAEGLLAFARDRAAYQRALANATTTQGALRAVAYGTSATPQSPQEVADMALQELRSQCPSCHGVKERCLAGAGEPDFRRLRHCRAYTPDGHIAVPQPQRPRQPWEPRPSRNDQEAA